MIVKPLDMAVVQQMNEISHIKQNENQRPLVEQQVINIQEQRNEKVKAEQVNKKDNADNREQKFDAKDKSTNEYFSDDKKDSKGKSGDGKVYIKGHNIMNLDIKV